MDAGVDVAKKMRAACHDPDATSLANSHPGAAGSLRGGIFETLTVTRVGVPPTLARTLRSTNESMIESCRDLSINVEALAVRADGPSCVAGMGEAAKHAP